MKVRFTLVKLGALLLSSHFLHAQNISRGLQAKFNNAVIARVAEVSAITDMPQERQLILAEYYNRRDSILAVSFLGEKKSLFKKLTDSLNNELDHLFKINERTRYYAAIHEAYNTWEATQTAAWLKKKYHASPELQTMVYGFMTRKNESLNKHFGLKANVDISQSIFALLNEFDSVSAIYRAAWAGEEWLEQKKRELEVISPLAEKERKILHDQFLYLCLKKGADYYRNFRESLQFATSKKAYFDYLYKDSLELVVLRQSEKELQDISYKYGLRDTLVRRLRPILVEKCKKEQELELRMPYGPRRDSLERDNMERSWAVIKKMLIRSGYFRLSDSRYVYAMRYQKQLVLTNTQLDSLVEMNYHLDILNYQYSLKDPWNKPDFSTAIAMQLENVLRPGQYDTLLKIESRPWALIKAEKDWIELKKHNLTAGYDSASTFQDIFYYHLNYMVVSRRYLNNEMLAQKTRKMLSDNKPAILKRLAAALQLNEYDTAAIH